MENMDNTRKKNLVIILSCFTVMLFAGHILFPNSDDTVIRQESLMKADTVKTDSLKISEHGKRDTSDKPVRRGIITRFKSDSAVALTFDACETKTPSFFDTTILDYLVREKIPFTLFVNSKFALRNMNRLKEIAQLPFVEIENHTHNHVQHMEKLSPDSIRQEVLLLEKLLVDSIGNRPVYFRFPGGNYDSIALHEVEKLGYKVVHWTFPSGDPDKNLTPQRLAKSVIGHTKPGNILIFHINGRGYSTGKALPAIIRSFRDKGFSFVCLRQVIQ